MNSKRLYYIAPRHYYYNYAIEGTCQISLAYPKGIYARAYSLKQATIYIKRRLAIYNCCEVYDIDIDVSDIELLEE